MSRLANSKGQAAGFRPGLEGCMLYPELPLMQFICLASTPMSVDAAYQVAMDEEPDGLRVFELAEDKVLLLAAGETELARPLRLLRETLPAEALPPPQVRLQRFGNTLLEPLMQLRATVAPPLAAQLRADVQTRGFTVIDDSTTVQGTVLRAEAPLRQLLGYPAALATLTQGAGFCTSWLDRYTPYLDVTL